MPRLHMPIPPSAFGTALLSSPPPTLANRLLLSERRNLHSLAIETRPLPQSLAGLSPPSHRAAGTGRSSPLREQVFSLMAQ
ncbi:hypothetical protein BOTBODRAFT_170836 [Botryobasidium botryosum FD-172 SS1]|uniref:Uncharacterized protein n=1 Tax=Botryobasidium botryosum (strain FD-172 SS1) TaxID=930990 RepID=A0A067N531_BOTB1|nr:hypothetical protein BOTBODRAFT_170836 [Botryobasidium botryosum FD-172 SS1]